MKGDAVRPAQQASDDRWPVPAWQDVLRAHPGSSPATLLLAALSVLLDRHGRRDPVGLGWDTGPGTAALTYLQSQGAEATWSGLVAAVESAAADTGRVRPRVVVDDGSDVADAEVRLQPGVAEIDVWADAPIDDCVPELLGEQLAQLVAHWSTDTVPPLGRLDVLTPAERVANGGTPARLPDYPALTLHQLVRLQAWRTPDAPALLDEHTSISYRELDHASSVLAGRLLAAGVEVGAAVGVCAERSFELCVAIVATLKAGAAFVFLDPELPPQRLHQLVGVCGATHLIIGDGAPESEPTDAVVVEMPVMAELLAAPSQDDPAVAVTSRDPAYVLFTSGSTGVPKAVRRSHHLHTSRIFLEQGRYPQGPGDRHLFKLPLSAREFFWPLATGGACVVVPPGDDRDDQRLLRIMERCEVSVLSIVPSMLRVLVADAGFAALRSLRHVFVGGEALHSDLESRVREAGPQVHTTYTLTEADYVSHRGGPAVQTDSSVVNIGQPLDMRVYVCDSAGRRVPVGAVGEIWAGGPGLADGYLGDPDRTAERFIANPFDDPQVRTVFKTGDLATVLADGTLMFGGRADHQVKIRGQRVEPSEVEHWIRQHPATADAAVLGYPDPDQGAVLVAFVAAPGGDVDDRELRAFLAERVPTAMVPRHLVVVASLPTLPSGKIDRRALRLPERRRPATLPRSTPGTGPEAARLIALWRRVLQTDDVGMDDDFVALGGDSLRVLLLRAAVQDEFDLPVDVAALMAATTVRSQLPLLVPGGRGLPTGERVGVGRAGVGRLADERARRAALRRDGEARS